ncbi:MAG: hypothetical protein ABW168_15070, partial [Sedimenticola sp.]
VKVILQGQIYKIAYNFGTLADTIGRPWQLVDSVGSEKVFCGSWGVAWRTILREYHPSSLSYVWNCHRSENFSLVSGCVKVSIDSQL